MSALAELLSTESEFLQMLTEDRKLALKIYENCYRNLRLVNGAWCGTQRFIYTVGVCLGLDDSGYQNRFCFDSEQNAALFLKEWDGATLPEIGVDGCKAIK